MGCDTYHVVVRIAFSSFQVLRLRDGDAHYRWSPFHVIGAILEQETIAVGSGIRELARLRKLYGVARWRKRKGIARIEFSDGTIRTAEIHWYEAHGIGRKELKIKRFLP